MTITMMVSDGLFAASSDEVRSGRRAAGPGEIAPDCAEARASLAAVNAALFGGQREVMAPAGHAWWIAERLTEAGWEVAVTTGFSGALIRVSVPVPAPQLSYDVDLLEARDAAHAGSLATHEACRHCGCLRGGAP